MTPFPLPVMRHCRGQSINVQFDATEDKIRFTDAGLASYDVLILLMNTGEGSALFLAQRLYLLPHPRATPGISTSGEYFIAIHLASNCLRNTMFYGWEVDESRQALLPTLRLGLCVTDGPATLQGLFDSHPVLQNV